MGNTAECCLSERTSVPNASPPTNEPRRNQQVAAPFEAELALLVERVALAEKAVRYQERLRCADLTAHTSELNRTLAMHLGVDKPPPPETGRALPFRDVTPKETNEGQLSVKCAGDKSPERTDASSLTKEG